MHKMDKLARYFPKVENSKPFYRRKICQNKIGRFHLKHPVQGAPIGLKIETNFLGKNQATKLGIEPATFRATAKHAKYCASSHVVPQP